MRTLNKLIIDTRIEILFLRQTGVSSTIRIISDAGIKKNLHFLNHLDSGSILMSNLNRSITKINHNHLWSGNEKWKHHCLHFRHKYTDTKWKIQKYAWTWQTDKVNASYLLCIAIQYGWKTRFKSILKNNNYRINLL